MMFKKTLAVFMALVMVLGCTAFAGAETVQTTVDAEFLDNIAAEVIARDGSNGFDYELVAISTASGFGRSTVTGLDNFVLVGTKENEDGSIVKEVMVPFVLNDATGEAQNAFVHAQNQRDAGISPRSSGWLSSSANNITLKYQAYYTDYTGFRQLYVMDKVSAYYTSTGDATVTRLYATCRVVGDLYSRSDDTLIESDYVQTAVIDKSNPSNTYLYTASFNWNSEYGLYLEGTPDITGHTGYGTCVLYYRYNGQSYQLSVNNTSGASGIHLF